MASSDPLRDVVDPAQPGSAFWPVSVEDHRRLLADLEAELASALRTIQALHRCPSCDRPLVRLPSGNENRNNSTPRIRR